MIIKVNRRNTTWQFMHANFKTKECYSIYIQLSLKNPWLLPHFENNFGNSNIPLYGWLFFYFGRITEGILYGTFDKNTPLKDKNGNKYWMFQIINREDKDKVRRAIKQHTKCWVERKPDMSNDGKYDLILHC